MNLTKEEALLLESMVFDLLSKGYVNNPQPDSSAVFSKEKAELAAHEISEMIQDEYFMEPRVFIPETETGKRWADTIKKLKDDLARPFNGFIPPQEAAGLGGGLGIGCNGRGKYGEAIR